MKSERFEPSRMARSIEIAMNSSHLQALADQISVFFPQPQRDVALHTLALLQEDLEEKETAIQALAGDLLDRNNQD
jgi:hypothetical protein